MSEKIRILIADDHQLFRDGVKALIRSAEDLTVIGEATTGKQAVQLADQQTPDLILMDVQMPDLNGIAACRQIVNKNGHIKILMLTMFDEDQSVFAAMRAGARGYVLKGAKHDEMLRAIRAVASGEAIFSPGIAERMIAFFNSMEPNIKSADFPELTEREREILALIARDYRNADIASKLVISPKTVRNHVSSILGKLQVADRKEAADRARNAGLG